MLLTILILHKKATVVKSIFAVFKEKAAFSKKEKKKAVLCYYGRLFPCEERKTVLSFW